jgi:hypothetical protein
MKKVIGFIGAWFFYYLGHISSKLMYMRGFEWLYGVYQNMMNRSVNIQDWANLDSPWKKP